MSGRVYRRFFKVTEGPLMDEVARIKQINDAAWKAYKAILKDICARTDSYLQKANKLTGVFFSTGASDEELYERRKIYKHIDSGWYPKQNSKEGRELHKRFAAVATENQNVALDVVGLGNGEAPFLMDGMSLHWPSIVTLPSDPPTSYIVVPWKDVDPAELEAYKTDNNTNSMTMDALLWEPTPEMTEVKSWEVDKAIDEWNNRTK